jgi:prepilin-type N-terminal cleavage/methylation domain-containing protein
MNKHKGFTLIEMMVVLAIIAFFSTVVLGSFQQSRVKARDAQRLITSKYMINALEQYYDQYNRYPPYHVWTNSSSCGSGSNSHDWCTLEIALQPFLPTIRDPLGNQANFSYFYDTDSGDNYKTYGFMMRLEDEGNFSKATSDSGFQTWSVSNSGQYYELGQQPQYCQSTQSGNNRNWWSDNASGNSDQNTVCRNAN